MTFETIIEQAKKLFPNLEKANKQAFGLRVQIDRLGMVNEIYGSHVGDQLLRQVAQRILGVTTDDALVGRAGGNEIVIADEAANASKMANSLVKVLRKAMKPPFQFKDRDKKRQKINLTLSGGIVLFPQNGTDLEELIERSRVTMQYAATQGSDSFRFFDWKAPRRHFAFDRISVENDLRTALAEEQFVLNFQPQINLETGDIHGVEALLRWAHPDHGLISPLDFIPIAEETGLIVPIGEKVLLNACRQAKQWQQAGWAPFIISVNVSAVQFRSAGIVSSIRDILDETGLDPKYLELELTESIVADDLESTKTILGNLKKLGLSLAIDDFGTGYSSLAYLTRLPFDTLKVDQAFVRSKDKQNWAIIRAVSQLARSLGLHIVAEGIETTEQTSRLASLGCNIGQGYFFSAPLSKDNLEIYLNDHPTVENLSAGREKRIRVGFPTFGAIDQFQALAMEFRDAHPEFDLEIHCDVSDLLLESLTLEELDIVVAITTGSMDIQPERVWRDQPVWLGSKDLIVPERKPISLLAQPEGSPFRKCMLDSLRLSSKQSRIVYQSPALHGLADALAAGMGVTALPLSALDNYESMKSGTIRVLDPKQYDLPALESVNYGIYVQPTQVTAPETGKAILIQRLQNLIDSITLNT